MSHRPRVAAVVLALAASLAGPSAARAAIGVTDVTVSPGSTQAGAPSSFGLGFRLSDPGRQVKDLTIHLPPGLVGNPLAQPACAIAQFTADACAPVTAVGTSQVEADPGGLTIDGTIYNLVPQPGEPARLGIVYRNPAIAPLFVQSAVALRADGGLDSIIKDLPREARLLGALPVQTSVKAIRLTLGERFAANPTSCAPAVSRVDVTSYAAPTTVASGEAAFTPTGCEKVPFAPRLAVSITGTAIGASPALSTVITQAAGEAGIRGAVVTLPEGIVPNGTTTPALCPAAQAAADACPPASIVGTAAVRSPLLADELTGDVFLVAGAPGTLPTLRIDLRGTLRIVLSAKVGFASSGLVQTVLEGIPDVPVSRFALTFKGGASGGVLSNTQALCLKARTYTAAFTAQSGATLTRTGRATLAGCPAAARRTPPRVTARLAAGGTLVLLARAGTRAIRGLKVTLPARIAAGRRTSSPGRVVLRGRAVTVTRLPARGSRRVTVHLGGARKLRGRRCTVTVRDAAGRVTVLRVLVR